MAHIVVVEGTRVVATLVGRFPSPSVFIACRLDANPADESRALRTAARAVGAALRPLSGEVLVVEEPQSASWRQALEAEGFRHSRRKIGVRRRLDKPLPPVPANLVWRSLADAGEAAFVDRLRTVGTGDPFWDRPGAPFDPAREWSDLLKWAGDPGAWRIVDDNTGSVGIVLPQLIRADLGTLGYVGVEPSRRGQGLGVEIHAIGLRLLADSGVTDYVGSTDERNARMRRVFARNGCPEVESEVYYVTPPDPEYAPP